MEGQHVITVKVSNNNKTLTTLQRNVNPVSIKEMIKEVHTIQTDTNAFLTKLVENEKHSDGAQTADIEEGEEDDAEEKEDNTNGDASILKRKLEEHVKDDKKLKI